MQSSQDRNSTLALCFVIALFGVGAASARAGSIPFHEAWTYDGPQPHGPGSDIIIDHQPLNSGGFTSDSLVVDFPNSQFVADDFIAPATVVIRRVSWHGFYDLNIEPTGNETIRLQVHPPRPSDGLPGQVIYTEDFLNPAKQWTNRFILDSGAPKEYRYQVDLAAGVPILQGQSYWLEIVGIGDINSAFRWEFSETPFLTGVAVNNPIHGDWHSTVPNLIANNAFQLSTIPEPSVLILSLLGFPIVLRRRPGMRAMGLAMTMAVSLAPTRATADPIPLQEAWTYDGPQPHGPGDGIIINYVPSNAGGLTSDSLYSNFRHTQFVADDFVAPATVVIRRISWHGFYDLNIEPPGDEVIRLQIHLPRLSDGLPGEVIYSEEFLNPARQWTGRTILTSGAPREHRYQVDLTSGLPIVHGQAYWLEVAGLGDIDTKFRWEYSETIPASGLAVNNPIHGDWQSTFPDLISNNAFQLSTIPEPSVIMLSLLGLPIVLRRRCRGR